MSITYSALRERFEADRRGDDAGGGAVAHIERALDAIGWRSAGGSSSDEVAEIAVHIIAECVNGHRDVDEATRALGDLLYNSAAMLDGSMFSSSAFVPAAEEVLERYVGPRMSPTRREE